MSDSSAGRIERTNFTRRNVVYFWGLLVLVALISLAYRWLSIPPVDQWHPYTLTLTPYSQDLFDTHLQNEPWKLFLPMDHGDGGRYAWNPAKSLPVYFLSKILSPTQLYLFLTSLMVVVLYSAAYITTRSLRFAVALGIIAALSTFLSYAFVYGSLVRNHLFIVYIALAAVCLFKYVTSHSTHKHKWFLVFAVSMIFVIFSGEWWLNLCASVLLSCFFIMVWAKRHGQLEFTKRFRNVIIFLIVSMVLYLSVRLQYASSYIQPGFENEMIFSYSSPLLMLEDIIINYFTYIHITLSSVLPSFLTFSPSYTVLGPELILAGQHGYHQEYSHLVVMSHLTSWRFIAGILFTCMVMLTWGWVKKAWKNPNPELLVPIILIIIVGTAYATYLPVKMRPMHLTAMLGYKTIMSSTALMVLLAWFVYKSETWDVSSWVRHGFVGAIMGSVILAAFTRPAAQSAGLEAVGLSSGGDPLVRIRELSNRAKD